MTKLAARHREQMRALDKLNKRTMAEHIEEHDMTTPRREADNVVMRAVGQNKFEREAASRFARGE